ncbi:hypothetical protein NXK88_002670 [Enterococcus hirae]|uniref:hypothetical protein n=1 Tax=Enterococcus hirae TaxID=1354 RepID=UPI002073A4A9|nr:hypothetical protein [Enterococcus hirae]EMF0203402.1 hypothetical protein [Enterococcus hirae]
MKKFFIFLLACSFFIFAKSNKVEAGFCYHDNYVKLNYCNNGVYGPLFYSATFTLNQFCVTPNQDPEGCIGSLIGKTQTTDNHNSFNFRCGRKGSNQVGNWFNAQTFNGLSSTFGYPAGKLNFAVKGQLCLKIFYQHGGFKKIVFDNVLFAQGNAVRNYWWFGKELSEANGLNNTITLKGKIFDNSGNYEGTTFVSFKRGGNTGNVIDVRW